MGFYLTCKIFQQKYLNIIEHKCYCNVTIKRVKKQM